MEIEAPGKLLAPRPVPQPEASAVPFARWPPNRMFTAQVVVCPWVVQAAAEPEPTVNVSVTCDRLSESVFGLPSLPIELMSGEVKVPRKNAPCRRAGSRLDTAGPEE